MSLIETYTHNSEGYNPFFIQVGWQVAQLNYSEEYNINNIFRVDVHYKTDEIFILTKGSAILISAKIKDDEIEFEPIRMQIGIVYNIPKNVWHNIAMKENAEVIIVEKDNTHLNDFEFYNLRDDQKERLIKSVKECF